MTDTTASTDTADPDALLLTAQRVAEGRSKLVLRVGLSGLAFGILVRYAPLVLASIVLAALGFGLHAAGRLGHYWTLAIPARRRRWLTATWVLLAASVVGLLATVTYARYGPGSGRLVWPLAIGTTGFGLLHLAARSIALEDVDTPRQA